MDSEKTKPLIQAAGSFDSKDDMYSLIIGFEHHAITLEGLCKKDMEELKSCIDCMLLED